MNGVFLWFRIGVGILLILALAEQSPAFYALLRVATTVAAAEVAWTAWRKHLQAWLLPFIAIAILWNPLREVRLPADTWKVLDVSAAVLFWLSIRYVADGRLLPTVRRVPYLALTFGSYGLLLILGVVTPAIGVPGESSSDPWSSVVFALLALALLIIIMEKIVYIAHVWHNPTVKYKIGWTAAILFIHLWSELSYYAWRIRPGIVVAKAPSEGAG